MPYLVDGNNLSFALYGAAGDQQRLDLCRLLDQRLASTGERVCVVFDGREPAAADWRVLLELRLELAFSDRRDADSLLRERIAADSAPRRLVVVSSDREVRSAARGRHCRSVPSEDFARELERPAAAPPAAPKTTEPSEKHTGLSDEQSRRWLEEFGLGGDDQPDPPPAARRR